MPSIDDPGMRAPESNRVGPDYWISEYERACTYLEGVRKGEVWEFGRSAGNRPLLAVAYGKKEPIAGRTSESFSAAGWGGWSTFLGSQPRQKQVFCFVGNIHGIETEGTVAALNLIHLLETGADLRGRRWDRLLEEAQKMRLVFVLHANPDGRVRVRTNNNRALAPELYAQLIFGVWKTGETIQYGDSKRYFPMPLEDVSWLGAYFNDGGVNLVHDNFLLPTAQPESHALAALYHAETPDCVILSHTNAGSLVMGPSPFLPAAVQHQQSKIGVLVGMRLRREGSTRYRIPECGPGEILPPTFHHEHVPYFVCGAVPLLVEYPSGYPPVCETLDQILDIGLTVFEEVFTFGNAYRFRPRSTLTDRAPNPFTGKPLVEG
jgi:hypothetical protein